MDYYPFASFRFSWTIENFDVAPHLPGEPLESPVFTFEEMGKDWQFSLLLYPRGSAKKDENYVSLFVKRLHDCAREDLFMECELSLVDADRKFTNTCKSNSIRKLCKGISDFSLFYERSSLLGSLKETLLPNNKLTVSCRLAVFQIDDQDEYEFDDDDDDDNDDDHLTSVGSDGGVLSGDFAELLESGIHSDLILQAEGKEFRVHKPILEARCPKLITRWADKAESLKVMVLPNMEARVLEEVLYYIYTGIFRDIEKLREAFAVINTYELPWLKKVLFPYSNSASTKTVIECVRVLYEWVIPDFKNFSQSSKSLSYFLISDTMPESTRMKVTLFANEGDDGQKNTFLKFQKLQNYYFGAIHLVIKASNRKDELILLKESVNVFENGEFTIPFDIGLDSVKLMYNDTLKLIFDIRTSVNGEQTSVLRVSLKNVGAVDVTDVCWGFHSDMYHFYENMKTGDVTLDVGPDQLTAHKAVLCSRSEVFRKMFQHDSLESRTNSVNIEDIDKEIMKLVLMYMYCGDTCIYEVPKVVKLYTAADKYQLLHLKERCVEFLKSRIDAENVGDMLLLADAHSDDGLKKRVYEFIAANGREILESERGLKVLEDRGDLYLDIMNVLLQHLSLDEEN